MADSGDSDLLQEFAMLSISSFKYQATDEGTNLVLSLNHPEPAVRVSGVTALVQRLSTEVHELHRVSGNCYSGLLCVDLSALPLQNADAVDRGFASSSLYSRLIDESADVSQAVLKTPTDLLLEYLSAEQLLDAINVSKRLVCLIHS